MNAWGRTIFFLAVFWLLTRWLGAGTLPMPDARTAAIWAAIVLGVFLLWRDGRPLLARYGLSGNDDPFALLERRLARGEIDLGTYRRLRKELIAAAGICGAERNKKPGRVLRGDPLA